ncbi:MAG: hypothetical protein ACPGSM_20755 [Thiolinea sp.]
MSELALAIVSVTNAIREGVVLIEDLHDFSERADDVTEEEAEKIIDEVRLQIIENRDTD